MSLPIRPRAWVYYLTFYNTFNLAANPPESILTQPIPQSRPSQNLQAPPVSAPALTTSCSVYHPSSCPESTVPVLRRHSGSVALCCSPHNKGPPPSTELVLSGIPCSELGDLLCFPVPCPSSTSKGSSRRAQGPLHKHGKLLPKSLC